MANSIKKMKEAEKTSSFFWGVLVLCLLIIGESLWVMNRFSTTKMISPRIKKAPKKSVVSVTQRNKASLPEVGVWIEGQKNLLVGKESEIRVGVEGRERLAINGIDLVLFYDPARIEVVDQNPVQAGIQVEPVQTFLGETARNLVDDDKGRVIVSIVNLTKDGAVLGKGTRETLAKIKVVPRSAGAVKFELKLATAGQPGTKVSKAGKERGLAVLEKNNYRAMALDAEGR